MADPIIRDRDGRDVFAEMRARVAQREALAASLAEAGQPVRFTGPNDWRALAQADMSRPEGFRLTRFDADGPMGHTEHPTLHASIAEALRGGFTPLSR